MDISPHPMGNMDQARVTSFKLGRVHVGRASSAASQNGWGRLAERAEGSVEIGGVDVGDGAADQSNNYDGLDRYTFHRQLDKMEAVSRVMGIHVRANSVHQHDRPAEARNRESSPNGAPPQLSPRHPESRALICSQELASRFDPEDDEEETVVGNDEGSPFRTEHSHAQPIFTNGYRYVRPRGRNLNRDRDSNHSILTPRAAYRARTEMIPGGEVNRDAEMVGLPPSSGCDAVSLGFNY
ncbi:hypothetical protein BU26DRAFT_558566 [Trematosphaeria pertusa]|uniref:Uncharacterized protein n=1 Tax=Trematosphaeria pertusa TaxID=390896 RepID=A0A6A6J3K9_9PLEO|nr:uncharacterized protein BU26DRAFT_558566 [Trematosphaeria pertusa]KAF2257158.1 hypothetical protein BU26DRAFT_558566 [Trematosphaeria pertusa]